MFFSAACFVSLGLMLVLLFSHTYNDILITTRHGINFWKILFSGDFLRFYQLNRDASGNEFYTVTQGCAYNILVYLAFALWNIPLALLEAFAGVDIMNNILCLVYMKLLPVTAMAVSALVLYRILALFPIPREKRMLMLYLYLTSALMISVVFIIAQYDIFSVLFQLLGVYAFLRGKDKQFVFWFGIAACFKYFALVAFVPLMLLRYKKVFSWLGMLAASLVPVIVTKLPFLLTPSAGAASLKGEAMGLDMLTRMLSYTGKEMNLFVVVYFLILVWCVLREKGERTPYYAIWAGFASLAAFCGLLRLYPYWSILLAPYLVLAIAVAPERIYVNLFLETVGTAALVFWNMVRVDHCYFGSTMQSMLMGKLLGEANPSGTMIHNGILILEKNPLTLPILNSFFIASMCALAFLTYPREGSCTEEKWRRQSGYTDMLAIRLAVTLVLCLMPIASLFT